MVVKIFSLLLFCNSKEAQLISEALDQVILLILLTANPVNRINATGKAVNSPPVMSEKDEAMAKNNSLVLEWMFFILILQHLTMVKRMV